MSTSPEHEKLIRELTDAFLQWPLPQSVCADLCATDPKYKNRSGTNLLTFTEAKAMMDQVVMPVLAEKVETWKQTALDAQADLEAAEQQLLALAEPEARIADLEARLAAAESEVAGLRAAADRIKGLYDAQYLRANGDGGRVKHAMSELSIKGETNE